MDRGAFADVFLSHSSVDRDFVQLLATLLKAEGINPWVDDVELQVGDSLFARIPPAIAEAACFVVVLSRHSVTSKWVQHELAQAMALELSGRGPRVIPVVIDDCVVPSQLADRVYGDFSKPEKMAASLARLVSTIRSSESPRPWTARDEFEHELASTTLRDADLRAAALLCSSVRSAARNILFAAYQLGHGSYRQVPSIRVLLFFVHPQFKCLRLQLYVTESVCVVHCRHRFTLDETRQQFLTPAALAWNGQRIHHMSYQTEYNQDPEAYIAEALQHGFTRDKVANIVVHVASSLSIPIERCVFYPSNTVSPVVFCIDSERKDVFPVDTHRIIADVVRDIVLDHNTGRRNPLQYEDRDLVSDNRGIIDEVTNEL